MCDLQTAFPGFWLGWYCQELLLTQTCAILAPEARSEGKATSGDFGGEGQRRCVLLISDEDKGGENAKDRWIGLNHVYFMSGLLCLGRISGHVK